MATFRYPVLGSVPRILWFLMTQAHLSAHDTARRERVMRGRAERRLSAGGAPVVVNVGVNTLKKEIELYSSLFAPLDSHHFVFVEPNKQVLPRLRQQIRKLGLDPDSDRVAIVNAAVCPESGNHLVLYGVNSSIEAVLHESIYEKMVEMTSLDKERLVKSFERWLILAPVSLEELMAYVEEVPVRCLSPADLLLEVGVTPEAVDFYKCDAEGYDAQLTGMFLALEGFRPAVVQFEWAWHHDHNRSKVDLIAGAVKTLHGRGYDTAKDGDEVIATASTFS